MRDELWKTDEFGKSHQGRVGVLLEDGTVPGPVYFDGNSTYGHTSSFWAGYSGQPFYGPRAELLRAVCSCGWTGTDYRLDWERIGDTPMHKDESTWSDSEKCRTDWDRHIETAEASTIAFPEEVADLLTRTSQALDRLASESPAAALKAAGRLEILARVIGYHAASAAWSMESDELGAALGITGHQAEELLDRYRRM
ncbi:hypothetical protein [Streptomyces sp. AP-93]|uniref:hypothetical protein n=1 Tax=Streptomyces sp. AP-93 TaxID=2929048 RepID=UPI001FAEE145|nr:hypothetical protein [Streptomyces sp. AP-93]MCJ0875265.1 hypothetical protein [Streptomyces sp. AP-93]